MKGLARFAALSAALAVAAGAFAAHVATPPGSDWLRTGAMYQLIHAVAALAIQRAHPRQAFLLLAGASIFSATLYAMAIGAPRWLGAITPIGGAAMIVGWLWLAFRAR